MVMVCVSVLGAGVWVWTLYSASLHEQGTWLLRMARNQARIIEAVSRFNAKHTRTGQPQGAWGATFSQIEDAHNEDPGFGETGEFVMARRDGQKIVFLLKRRFSDHEIPKSISFNAGLAIPMHQALMGRSGTIIGQDYRNVTVLAAYVPVAGMGLGIVAKIDLSEVQKPFLTVGMWATLSTLLITMVGAVLSHRISVPLIDSLRDSEERKGTILQSALDAIVTIDEEGKILEFNPSAEKIFGYTTDETREKNVVDLIVSSRHRDAHIAGLKRYVAGGKSKIIGKKTEVTALKSDGTEFPAELAVSQIQLKDRRLFTAFIRDITESKLDKLALQTAKDDAEKANLAKSEFLASMSHDLRTPLNAIMGFSQLMTTNTFGPLGHEKYEGYAGDIHKSGTLLVSLIDDILDLSKIEAGKYKLYEENLDIVVLVNSSVTMISTLAQATRIRLSMNAEAGLPLLRGDERSIVQILNNLLSNAVKFTPQDGKIDISVTLDESDTIRIQVADSGIGMTEEGIIKALKPFEQADSAHSKRHEGTGLGLHLCQKLMKMHGGAVEIESDNGAGTTVTVRFPPERTIRLLEAAD